PPPIPGRCATSPSGCWRRRPGACGPPRTRRGPRCTTPSSKPRAGPRSGRRDRAAGHPAVPAVGRRRPGRPETGAAPPRRGSQARRRPHPGREGLREVDGGPFVELPIGATEDRVVGTLDLEGALLEGRSRLRPGLLAAADGGVLYVD